MIDKSLRKATAERFGKLIVVHMTGGGDCLWLNMYLDEAAGQMTCDSDIGSYVYNWGPYIREDKSWTDFICDWLSNDDWLLRKCILEQREELALNKALTANALRKAFQEENEDNDDIEDLLEELELIIEAADGYDDEETWAAVINEVADARHIELPDGWWDDIVTDYTPWQKRFAEICREVLVPAIEEMQHRETAEGGETP